VVDIKSKEDFDKYRGKLRGAMVMNGRPAGGDIGFKAEAERLDEAALTKQSAAISPGPPSSLKEEDEEFDKALDTQVEIQKFFASEGVAAVITASSIPENVRVSGYYDQESHAPFPAFVFSREHYGRLIRMLDKTIPIKLSLSLSARFTDNVEGFNVVAEIPGSDPQLRNQIVMLGGHLDSWHAGTGATDNGAGCAVAMEAVRILESIGVVKDCDLREIAFIGIVTPAPWRHLTILQTLGEDGRVVLTAGRQDWPQPELQAELQAWVRSQLAPYAVPVTIRSVDALPRTSTMKVAQAPLTELLQH
jgi:hypothetical protein